MSEDDVNEPTDLIPASTPTEKGLDVATVVASAVPWIGGPVSAVLGGMSLGRKLGRVREVLEALAADLKAFKAATSEDYVKTEEFEELLEATLRKAAEERSEEKRQIYRAFLTDAIMSPGEPYEEQLRFLRTLEQLQPDHLRIVKALSQPPEGGEGMSGSPGNTLGKRLPDIPRERIADLVAQLNDMRVTSLTSLNVMMTFHGAQDLRHRITPYGRRLLKFIVTE
jgi:hypothetical protein